MKFLISCLFLFLLLQTGNTREFHVDEYFLFRQFEHSGYPKNNFPRFPHNAASGKVFIALPFEPVKDFSFLEGRELTCFCARIAENSNFKVEMLQGKPLEILDISHQKRILKLSELKELFTPALKELYLMDVEIDDISLLTSLSLESLGFYNIIIPEGIDFMREIAKMKNLKNLALGHLYFQTNQSDSSKKKYQLITGISTKILLEMHLTGIDISLFPAGDLELLKIQTLQNIRLNDQEFNSALTILRGRQLNQLQVIGINDIRKIEVLLKKNYITVRNLYPFLTNN